MEDTQAKHVREIKLIKFLFDRFSPNHMPSQVQLIYAIQDFERINPIMKDYTTEKFYPVTKQTRGGFNGSLK